MKIHRYLLAASVAALLTAASAFAGDPSGTWTWTTQGRDGQTRESTLKLELKDGKLTGSISGFQGGENAISEATFTNDEVAFKVSIERNGTAFVTTYKGKLEGDTITGTFSRPGRGGGEPRVDPWKAARKKA